MSYWDLYNDPTCAFWAPLDGNMNDVRPGALNGTFTRDAGPTTPQYATGLFGKQAFDAPTGYGSGGNHPNGGIQFPAAAGGTADSRTVLFRFKPHHNLSTFGRTVWQDNTGAQRQWRFTYNSDRRHFTNMFGASVANYDALNSPAQTAGIWQHICRRGGGGVVSGRINGVTSTGLDAQAALFDATHNFFVGRGEANTNGAPGLYQDVAVFNRHLSDGEADEYQAGPEPTNTVAPIASFAANLLSCTTGTWENYDNGAPTTTYQWQRLSGSWGNVSGATSSTLTPTLAGDYRCVVTRSNDGGSHLAANSNTVAVTLGRPRRSNYSVANRLTNYKVTI